MVKPVPATFVFSMIFSVAMSQTSAVKKNDVLVLDENNHAKSLAWAGGLNAPQFSEIDLNFDGIQDLFVFDREGNRVTTYINNGTVGTVDYSYAPQYEDAFPEMNSWALLVDYNGDNKKDIFTYNSGGIRVFKNESTPSGLKFTLVADPYLTTYYNPGISSNLYVSSVDIPAIADIDFDGDIDVLAFGPSSLALSFYENFAVDSGSLEQFRFHANTFCWGKFEEDVASNKVALNKGCPKSQGGNKHAGSTILAFDADNDLDMDLLLGDLTYPNLIFLKNGGSKSSAFITSQDTAFPSNSIPVDLNLFPAAYLIDVNNDGKKDLLVSPNSQSNIENTKSVWYYENTGSSSVPVFTFKEKDFLQSEMIDHGTGSYPAFVDFDFDGLMDLVVGNNGYYMGPLNPVSSLSLYQNVGNLHNPAFRLIDKDYAGLSKINLNTQLNIPTYNAIPAFGDLSGDGIGDMLIGDYNGKVHLFINHPKDGLSVFDLEEADLDGIDVSSYANPDIFDLDGDGLVDLILGTLEGKLEFHKNEGTSKNPDFSTTQTTNLGYVNTRSPNYSFGFSQPYFYNDNGTPYLICGSESGWLYRYDQINNNTGGKFHQTDSIFLGIDVGRRSHIAAYDLDNDGFLELIIGNNAGGLSYYETDMAVGIDRHTYQSRNEFDFDISDLGNGVIHIHIDRWNGPGSNSEFRIFSMTGKLIYRSEIDGEKDVDLASFSEGIYFIQISNTNDVLTKKFTLHR